MTAHKEETITYGAGRFVIEIPAVMQFNGTYSLRTHNIVEVAWPNAEPDKHATEAWQAHVELINKIEPPETRDRTLIEEKELPGIGKWCKAVFYYHEPYDPDRGALDLLINYGNTGLWIKSRNNWSSAKDIVFEIATEQARAYRPPSEDEGRVAVLPNKDSFYLRYGAIDLPFEYKESVNIAFRGHPMDNELSLEIETDVMNEAYKAGIIDQLLAIIATKWAPELKIDKIRTKKRTVAGLKGEEVVYLATESETDKAYTFIWGYPGKARNAHHPLMKISMESQADNLEQKLALWDAVLDSMRPACR